MTSSAANSSVEVTHDVEGERFTVALDEGMAVLAYERPDEHTIDLQHTAVPPDARGEGVGDALVRAAFAHAREERLRVIPTCQYVAAWLKRHPDEQDLTAR